MWDDFSGKSYSREDFADRIESLTWRRWRPVGIVLHNTAAPTLAQWAESGPRHEARIRNLQAYYEDKGWSGGPHWFVSREWITEFNNPLRRGTHSPSFNATHFGIEMVGDYSREKFNSGDGAKVRDNAVFLMAVLCRKFDWNPAKVIKFHKEDPRTDHDCPGKFVVKSDIINRVRAEVGRLDGDNTLTVADRDDGDPDPPPKWRAPNHPAFSSGDDEDAPAQRNIVATVFGETREPSAYGGRVDPSKPGVALPYRFRGERPLVEVTKGSESVICKIVDVGPWNVDDPYWETQTRPQAESGKDKRGRRTNRAGIDLTPAAAEAVGIDGKGTVNWQFVKPSDRAVAMLDDDGGDGFFEPKRIFRSRTAQASAAGIFTTIFGALTDWKMLTVLCVFVAIALFVYVIWLRRKKCDIVK